MIGIGVWIAEVRRGAESVRDDDDLRHLVDGDPGQRDERCDDHPG